jgi:hypothetical protein
MKKFIDEYFPLLVSLVGMVVLCLSFTLQAKADEDSSWYTVNGHVRAVYYDPKNWRTHLVFETDSHQVLDVNLLTQAAFGPPPVWVGEYIKLDYGHRYTDYEDKPFLKYEVTPLAETMVSQPAIVTVPACIPQHVHRRKHLVPNHSLPLPDHFAPGTKPTLPAAQQSNGACATRVPCDTPDLVMELATRPRD